MSMVKVASVYTLMLACLLVIVACGKEAPPRATRPDGTSTPQASRVPQPIETPTESLVSAAPPDSTGFAPLLDERRAMGDPHAPIMVIEYGDYQ